MTAQPKALRVAEAVEAHSYPYALAVDAARLLREQHAEIERLRAEIERAFDLGYDKGVQDTLLDYGVEP